VKMRRLLGATLTVPVLLAGFLLVTAGPAAACTCVEMSDTEHAARVDAVFVGRLVGSRVDPSALAPKHRDRESAWMRAWMRQEGEELLDPRQRAEQLRQWLRSLDPVVLTFEVSRVYKGVVGERQEVVIRRAGGSCEHYVPAGPGPWLVFASQASGDRYQLDPGQYLSGFSSLCRGSRALANGGEPAPGPPASEPGWPTSLIGVVLVVGVGAGLGLAALRARRRASAD
jgi:hypothetical protein